MISAKMIKEGEYFVLVINDTLTPEKEERFKLLKAQVKELKNDILKILGEL